MPISTEQSAVDAAAIYVNQNKADFDHNHGRRDLDEMCVAARAAFLAGFKAGYDLCAQNEGN